MSVQFSYLLCFSRQHIAELNQYCLWLGLEEPFSSFPLFPKEWLYRLLLIAHSG